MNVIRVVLGDIRSSVLRDILEEMTGRQSDMEVVGHAERLELSEAIEKHDADVLICEIGSQGLPQVCRDLLGKGKETLVVGLARDGREALICIGNTGAAQLVTVIRTAVLGAVGEKKLLELVPLSKKTSTAPTSPGDSPDHDASYPSNWDCIEDQLRLLDLALSLEVEFFNSSIWAEDVQRLQGLAISPEEVRALLKPRNSAAHTRQDNELWRTRVRLAQQIERRIGASRGRDDACSFVQLVEGFDLSPFELFCVTLALAPEIDRNKYEKVFAYLHDDATRRQPSFELAVRLFEPFDADRRLRTVGSFDLSRPLRRWKLLRLTPQESGEAATAFGRRIELDDRIARFLLGAEGLGTKLETFTRLGSWPEQTLRVRPPLEAEQRLARVMRDVLRGASEAPPHLVAHIHGRLGTGRRSLIANVCRECGLQLIRVDAGRFMTLSPDSFEESLMLLARENALHPSAICLENIDTLLGGDAEAGRRLRSIAQSLEMSRSTVSFMVGERPWMPSGLFRDGVFRRIELELPDTNEAQRIWANELEGVRLASDAGGPEQAARELAGRFVLSPGQIQNAVATARTRALWQTTNQPLTLQDLYQGCREQCSQQLGNLAQQVKTEFQWKDLILPARQLNQLRELERSIRNAGGVLDDWDFRSRLNYGRGITALFSGPSGTGKTMAAGILARELGLDLYKIDLSRVVSKYIGETEKNLDRIFQEAEDANAMLFFDEADALFGKRSAVKDAHDRYANIEIAYLLQKMEERLGATVLATNLKKNMDEAFLRRIRYAVEFPMPEYQERLQIWRRSLPEATPLGGDVDLSHLAKRLKLSGGSIMNVCVGAASLAYEPGGVVSMDHLLHAGKRELQKLGRQYNEADFGPTEVAPANAA